MFWVEEYEYVLMCLVVTVATFVYMFESRHATEPPVCLQHAKEFVGLAHQRVRCLFGCLLSCVYARWRNPSNKTPPPK